MFKRNAFPIGIVVLALAAVHLSAQQSPLQKVTINYPTRSAGSWPMFIAKEGGYYEKYGLDVKLEFGAGLAGIAMITSGEAVMTNSSMGSMLNKGPFSLMAAKGIGSIKDLKGKRIAVSQLGDAPYNYSVALLRK